MKKLLSLLSVLTISGTAVPTTIAASPYQKEEILNRNKRQTNQSIIDFWTNDINNWKNNIQNEKNELLRRLGRNPGFSPQEQQIQKQNKIMELHNIKMQELENKVNQINESLKPSNTKIVLKACMHGAGAFAMVNGVATAVAPNPITALFAAISTAVSFVCGIIQDNITR